ncbi:MAG: polysaccharide pyruvyl transferase CsaB [Clostridiales bacterium]
MKKILLTGYYGFDNIGDEAVLQEIICRLQENADDIAISVLSNAPQKTEADYHIRAIDRWSFPLLAKELAQTDLLILGGGSLLQDITGSKSLFFYLLQILLAHFRHCPVFLYAQGIGPINKGFNKWLTGKILKKCRGISVRDRESADFLQKIGLSKEKIAITVDPVLAGSPKSDLPLGLPSGRKLALALRNWQGIDSSLAADLADSLAKKGWQIVFLPFHEPSDRLLAEEIAGKMKEDYFLPQDILSYQSMSGLIRQMDIVIAMRLHALIMAAAAGIPFGAISYDPKIDSFCHEMGLDPLCHTDELVDAHSLERILSAIDILGNDLPSRRDILSKQKLQWVEKAQANALLVREILEAKR